MSMMLFLAALATWRSFAAEEAIESQYQLVGHTHESLDPFFSRLILRLNGRKYPTLAETETIAHNFLKARAINWSYHSSLHDGSRGPESTGLFTVSV